MASLALYTGSSQKEIKKEERKAEEKEELRKNQEEKRRGKNPNSCRGSMRMS